MKPAKKKTAAEEALTFGLFSKKEGAQKIAKGFTHVHSAPLGDRDACVRATAEALKKGTVPTYPWEKCETVEIVKVTASSERYQIASKLINHPLVVNRRKFRERLEVVLEELLTNALYHAYRSDNGDEKYPRKLPVQLPAEETLTLKFSVTKEGIFLSIADQGGNLSFNDISAAFARTYGSDSPEIQGKESGAGLGIYMVFEATSHYKAVCVPGKRSEISVWISDKRSEDVDTFSFNYFTVKE
jgi:anti-sigma regulatory factor (Ser/Thr protein kinase)